MCLGLRLVVPCNAQLSATADKTVEQIKATYNIAKDIPYGTDKEQTMDIYLPEDTRQLNGRNFTIVFLHGGGYYMSDKSREERYIEPYLKKGYTVVNMNYRLKRGIPVATEDLTNALNFLKANKATYLVNLDRTILTGFSAGAHIASNVGAGANNPAYINKLSPGITISGVINFSGPVDGLDVVEKVFIDHEAPLFKEVGNALFPTNNGYVAKDQSAVYEPITYFDKNDPPFFVWYGGKDDQIPAVTFERFVSLLNEDPQKNRVVFIPDGQHSPTAVQLENAYRDIFAFLERL